MELRPHQIEKSKELLFVLKRHKLAYLRGEVRSGKTITVLETARLFNVNNVLFITKKKAISSIQSDFDKLNFQYTILITNYESVHKINRKDFDLVIYDECHTLGGFPKPSVRTKLIKKRFSNIPCILLSGTPAAESYSQFYHQFFISAFSPFEETNFYKWARNYVTIEKKKIGTHEVNDYSKANKKAIEEVIKPFTIIMTQNDAGIESNIKEYYLKVETPKGINYLVNKLIKDRAIEGKKGFIMAETPAKLQSKVHQICNGTVILETTEGESIPVVLHNFKGVFIKNYFKEKKIVIMYYYQSELEILKKCYGDCITTDLSEFDKSNKSLAIQQSSTEGMNLSKAECIVYYNFHFSGKNYIQSRDRLTVKGREKNDVYFILEKPGINSKILKAIQEKKDYNSVMFKSDFL